jgi:hypothetical protein
MNVSSPYANYMTSQMNSFTTFQINEYWAAVIILCILRGQNGKFENKDRFTINQAVKLWVPQVLAAEISEYVVGEIVTEPTRCCDSSVCISTVRGLDGLGSIPGRSYRFPSSTQHPSQI